MESPSIPSSELAGLPAGADPNFFNLLIQNDTLYQKDVKPYTSRDIHVGAALFVLTQLVPILSSLILILSRKTWWKRKWFWSMPRLVVLWLFSIQIVAAVAHYLGNGANRVLFAVVTLHLQTEYMFISFLLGASPLVALGVAYAVAFSCWTVQLLVADLSVVYFISATFGVTDYLIPLLFLYGKQWLYATAAIAHLVSAFSVFSMLVKDYGSINYSAITFFTLMIMNGALVTALLRAIKEPQTKNGPIQLNDGEEHAEHAASNENPLAGIDIPTNTLIKLSGAALCGSLTSACIYTFVVGAN